MTLGREDHLDYEYDAIKMIMIMIMTLTRVDPFALKGYSTSGKRVPVQILQFR